MSTRTALVLLAAMVCGVIAIVLMVASWRPAGAAASDTAPVVVAAGPIRLGVSVTAKDVTTRPWPKEMLPEGSLSTEQDAIGRAVRVPIVAGQPVLDAMLGAKNAKGLNSMIPQGMRAYTIQASRASSTVAGFVLPGSLVDVLLNYRGAANDESGGRTKTILKAIKILAVDQNLDAPTDNRSNPKDLGSVTLLVTPKQAQMLDVAQSTGQLTLALRNPLDVEDGMREETTFRDLMGLGGENEGRKSDSANPLASVASSILRSLLGGAPKSSNSDVSASPGTAEKAEKGEKGSEIAPEVSRIVTLRGSQRGLVYVSRER